MRVLKNLIPVVAMMLILPAGGLFASDWITLPANPPTHRPPATPNEQRSALLKKERSEMSKDWQHAAQAHSEPRRRPIDWSSTASYAFTFNDSWNTPLRLPSMITAQDFPNIAPPLPPKLPGLSKPLGGAPSSHLPPINFSQPHW